MQTAPQNRTYSSCCCNQFYFFIVVSYLITKSEANSDQKTFAANIFLTATPINTELPAAASTISTIKLTESKI